MLVSQPERVKARQRERETEREGAREKGLEAMEVVHVYCEIHVCPPLQFNTKMKVCL